MEAGRSDPGQFWSEFARDPREQGFRGLRAGDRDHDLVSGAVSEAYADGRLTREEMDDRLSHVQRALVPSLICMIIWIGSMVGDGGWVFPWPIFVILGTGSNLFQLVVGRASAVEEEREKLRKKRARQLAIEQGYSRAAGAEVVVDDVEDGHANPHRPRDSGA